MAKKNTANVDKWTSKFRGFGPVMKKLAGATIEGVTPGIKGAVTSTTDVLRDSRLFIMESKSQVKQQAKTLATTMVGREAMDTITSAVSDLKNGTFSMDKLSNSSYDMADDFEDSMDFDYDMNDPASAAMGESKKNTAILGKAISQGSAATISGMQQMTETLANVQIKASAAASKQATNIALVGINQTMNQLIGVNNKLDAINQNLVSLLDFHTNNTSAINEQASAYFTQSTQMINSMGEALSGIKDFMESYKNIKDEKDPEWDEFDFASGFNMNSYKEMIKKNVKNSMAWTMLEMGKSMFSMSSMMGESPIDMVLPSVMSKLIPKNIRNSLSRTDKMFSQTISDIIYRLGDMADSDDFFKSMIGSIFGKKREKPIQKLKMGDFKKTAMSWNGIAQQTLVEVIPSYLARIESGINKSELRFYDMESGRFDSMSNIKKGYETKYKNSVELALSSYVGNVNTAFEKAGVSQEKVTEAQQKTNELLMKFLTGDKSVGTQHDILKTVYGYNKDAGLTGNALRDTAVEFNESLTSLVTSLKESVTNLNTAERHLFNTKGIELDAIDRNFDIFSGRKFINGRALDELSEEERLEAERNERNGKGVNSRWKKFKNLFTGGGSDSERNGGFFRRTSQALDNGTSVLWDVGHGLHDPEDGNVREIISANVQNIIKPASSQATLNTDGTRTENRINREVTRTSEAGLTDSLNANQNQIETNSNRTARIIHDLENSDSPDDDKNSIKAMVLSLHHNFLSPMVNGIFGKNGIIRSFFKDIFNNEHVKKIRDKLFDEETGVFGGVTVWFKDQMKHLKYTFNGEGYTDSKGNVYDEKEDSVFDRIASGYDKIRRLAFTHWFGKDFEENETYKKYLGWTDFKKKREDKRAARLAAKEGTEVPGNEELNENPSPEAKIDLHEKYKDSWNQMDVLQQSQLYGGDIDSFIEEEEAKLKEGTQSVTDRLKSLANSISEMSGEVVDKVRSNVDKVVGNISDSDIKKVQDEQNKSIKEKISGFLPIGLTGATLGAAVGTFSGGGLVASAFLPGGPISGAIAGIGISLLSRSDKFKEFLFGKEDENGEKTGGLISQRTQKFFKDNAPAIAAGAVVGTLKGALGIGGGGLLGTLFAGPVGGALLGVGLSLVKRSETFQKVLFGEEDEDGKRIGGLLNKENGKLSKAFSKSGGFIKGGLKGLGIGAVTGLALGKMGFIGSALSLGGPVGMGLMGLGLGIASQTEKFKTLLFGEQEFDKDGNPIGRKKNGLLYKIRNNLVLHVFEPVRDKLNEETAKFGLFLAKNIKKPFQLTFGPLIHSVKDLKEDIAESVRATFEKVGSTITDIFRKTFGKMFSPIIKAMGFVAKHTVRLPFDAMKLSLMPLSGALKLASLTTRKKRWAAKRKEHTSILSAPAQLIKGTIQNVKAQSEEYDQDEFSGKLGKVNKGLTMIKDFRKGLRDSYRSEMDKYEEGKAVEGDNTFGYLNAKKEAKKAKERFKNFKRDSKTQKKIGDIRREYAKRFGSGEVDLNDEELEIAKKRLKKAGLDPSWVRNNKDLNDLIYHRDDFYDKHNPNAKKKSDKRSFEETVREDGVKINESPDQIQDRERQKKFFNFIQDAMIPIKAHFVRKNEEEENADGSIEEGILDTLQNIEQSSEANAVMNTIEQGKETGATDTELRDAAGERITSLTESILDRDRDRQKDESRDAREAEEDKRAKSGGISSQEEQVKKDKNKEAKINDGKDEKERKTVFGAIGGFVKGIFGGGFNLFKGVFTSKKFWKLAFGGLATYGLFGKEINQIFTNTIKPWWTETAWPFLQNNVFPKLGEFFNKAVDFVVEKLPDIASKVTQRVIDNMDTFINAGWEIVKSVVGTIGGNVVGWLKDRLGLGDADPNTRKFSSKEAAEEYVKAQGIEDKVQNIDEYGGVTLDAGYDIKIDPENEMNSDFLAAKGYNSHVDEDGNIVQDGRVSTFNHDLASTTGAAARAGIFHKLGTVDYLTRFGRTKGGKVAKGVAKGLGKLGWWTSRKTVGALSHIPVIKWPFKVMKHGMDLGEAVVTGKPGKHAAKGVKKAASFIRNLAKGGSKEAAEEIIEKGAKEGTEATIVKATGRTVEEVFKDLRSGNYDSDKMAKELVEILSDEADDVAKNKGIIKTLLDKIKNGILKLKDKVVAPLKNIGVKADEWGKAIIKFFDNIGEKLLKSNNKLLKKIGSKITEKTAEATARTGAAATIVVQIGFSIYDGIEGALTASHLFGVPESEVDFGMRTISSIMNIILGLGPVAYIDILLEVLKMLNIVDLKGMLARWLYSKLGGKNTLEAADAEMDAITAKYNKLHGSQLSKQEVNDVVNSNKGVWGRIKQFGSWSGNGIARLWRSDEEIAEAEKKYNETYHADKIYKFSDDEKASYEKYKKNAGSKALSMAEWYTKTDGGKTSIGNGPGSNRISSTQKTLGYGTTMQNDPRWGNMPIGKFPDGSTSTMATGGCGPTALSMVASGTDPVSVAKYANKKGYIQGGGATSDLFTKGAEDFGLNAKKENKSSLKDSLKSGKQVVISGKSKMNGPYTEAGHIIVASGLDSNGNVQVKDPMRGTRVESLSNLTSGMTNSWSYSKKGRGNLGYGPGKQVVIEGYGPEKEISNKYWFEYNGKKYVIDESVSKITYTEVAKKDEGKLQDAKHWMGKGQSQPQPFLNYINNIPFENGIGGLDQFSLKNRKVEVKMSNKSDLNKSANKNVPDLWAFNNNNFYMNPYRTKLNGAAPSPVGMTPLANNATEDDIKRRKNIEMKIRVGYQKLNNEYKFNTTKFYEFMQVQDLRDMAEAKPSLLTDEEIPFFRKVYNEFVVTGDYKNTDTIKAKQLESIQGRHQLSETLGGYGTYGTYEYKNGFPFFQTDDPRWADIPWRGSNVKTRGGDLASLAMVASAYGPNILPPDYINKNWLDGRYINWVSPSDGLNQDLIFTDGGFNALKETQVDGKRLKVQRLSNEGSIETALKNKFPVVITGYRYNGSMFGGYYDKAQKGSDTNPVLSQTQVNVSDPDSYGTLVARAMEGDYVAVNDPFTTLEQASVFNKNRLFDKLGNGVKAWKSAYMVSGPNGENIDGPVDFSNKEGGVSDYESISEAQGLTGKLGALFNNLKAVFDHMFESLTGGTAYRSIKEINEIEDAGQDSLGVGYDSSGVLQNDSGSEANAYKLAEAYVDKVKKEEKLRQKESVVTYEQAFKKYNVRASAKKKYPLKLWLPIARKYKAIAKEGTPDYETYLKYNDAIVKYCRKAWEENNILVVFKGKNGKTLADAKTASKTKKDNTSNKVTSNGQKVSKNYIESGSISMPKGNINTKNIGILDHAPMSGFGIGYGTGSSRTNMIGSNIGGALSHFASVSKSVAKDKPGMVHHNNQGIVGQTKTLSGATVSSSTNNVVNITPTQTDYYTNATQGNTVDLSKASWEQKLEAVGFATTAQLMGEDYETAKSNYLMQQLGNTASEEGGTTTTAALVDPSDEAGYIWNELIKNGATPHGAAGVMGNFEQESGNHAVRLQGDYASGYPKSHQYTKEWDANPDSKIHDKKGYGLAQWTYWSLKKGLIDFAKSRGTSVGDIGTQVAFFRKEMTEEYPNVWNTITTTNNIADASNKMLHEFERPADQSYSQEQRRIKFGQAYYDKFAGDGNSSATVSYGPGNKYTLKIPKSVGFGKGAIGYGASWISIVQAVKQAIAAQQPGYSQSRYITINVGGIEKSVRTDCSGFVSACVSYYTGQDFGTTSSGFLSQNIPVLLNAGFQFMGWPGWEGLVPGDIIAVSGHVEIFAGNEGGTHMVYNCGSDFSTNNPGMTKTSRTAYSGIWRSPENGSAVLNTTGIAGTTTNNNGGTNGGGAVAATGLDLLFASLNEVSGATNKSFLGFGPGSKKSMNTPEGYFTKTLGGVVTSGYGHRGSSLGNEFHRGLDIGAPYGTDITSPIEGDVVSTGTDAAGYGNYAVVQDESGTKHLFGHMQNPVGYGPGTHIYKDGVIGQVGSSGKSTGSHLHYEVRKNDSKFSSVDPTSYKFDTSKSHDTLTEDIGYGSGNMDTNTAIKEKLTVALNTKNIETKMDTLIDVMRTWAERDEANEKSMTLNNVTNNTSVSYGSGSSKSTASTVKKSNTAPKTNYEKMSLADIHKSIASKK